MRSFVLRVYSQLCVKKKTDQASVAWISFDTVSENISLVLIYFIVHTFLQGMFHACLFSSSTPHNDEQFLSEVNSPHFLRQASQSQIISL